MDINEKSKQPITVLTYGTFDLFHVGHLNLLNRLRALGDRLVVGCSTDEFNSLKGKKTIVPYDQRCAILKSLRVVDKVIPESSWEQKRSDILHEKVAIFGMGGDWVGRFDDLEEVCRVIYLPRTTDVSTTEIKDLVSAAQIERIAELKSGVERLRRMLESF
jgi:glycerol-3-phosphate cytidylyltransferase